MQKALTLLAILLLTPLAFAQPAVEQLHLAPLDPTQPTYRLYEGLTLLISNPDGKAFKFTLDVRDLNLMEPGPQELLFKIYDPAGRAIVREIIPDDGVTTPINQGPTGGWDHEGWYYLYQYNRGANPMLRWSAFAAPDRLAATPVRSFERSIPAGAKGIYRVVLVGERDHVVTTRLDPALPSAVAANPYFLHVVGKSFGKRYVFVPRGTVGLTLNIIQHDRPRSRTVTIRDEAGVVVATASGSTGVGFAEAKPAMTGEWDDRVFSVELSDDSDACLLQLSLMQPKHQDLSRPIPPPAVPAFYAGDAKTARALRNGAIEADGEIFWQPAQVRLHRFLQSLKPADFVPLDADGKPAEIVPLKARPSLAGGTALNLAPNRNAEFVPLNGVHEKAPLADGIMFSYELHKNRQALNLAIKDLASGLRIVGPGDHVMNATWRGMSNLAYEFGTYRFHWWRPVWRILQSKDTPGDAREAILELVTNSADRLAFCRNWERVNGNAFSTVLCALKYAHAGTSDPLNKQLLDTFHDRFTTGGFGPRVGLGPSGAIQEEFVYDNHYGSYPLATVGSVTTDFDDPRFAKIHDGLLNFYSYVHNPEVAACPFSGRTAHNPDRPVATEGPNAWKGYPGPDLTESINNAGEFFAARRPGYYILSYHGRITPKWQTEAFNGQMGWSGGVLCQFVVPGKGTVLASTLDAPGYGMNAHPSQWRTFRINAIVGVTADGKPLISADSEHLDARLDGNKVTSSGEVRDSSVHATRSYTYNPDHVVVEANLRTTDDDEFLGFWFKSPFRGHLAEAWEMIPFVAAKPRGAKGDTKTTAKLLDASGREVGDLTDNVAEGQTIVIDRGGFGVRIELEKPMSVKRGEGNTVMIQLIPPSAIGPRDAKTKPNIEEASIRYKLVPFS
jgi:hypothetical protein